MNILPGNLRFGAGQPVKRLEDQRLLTGKGQFIDDKPEDGALWLHVLRSPHAHAKIASIDSQAAGGMPGVEAVYTGADLVADDIGTIPTLSVFMRPDGKPMTVPPRRLLAHEIVRFAGEPVAAVVATSRVAAQTAAEAIAIEYEILPSVVDPVEATKPGAPVVWAEAPDNIVAAMSYGDAAKVEAAFAGCRAYRLARSGQPAADPVGDGAALDHRRDREENRPADPACAVADPGLDPRPARRCRAEAAEGKRARAGRRYRRRLWPEDQSLSGRRHRRLCRDQTEPQGALARRPHRRIRRRHPWPRSDLDRRIRARRQGPRAGLSGALDRRHRRLFAPVRAISSRWCSAPSCSPASTTCRWCITRSNR